MSYYRSYFSKNNTIIKNSEVNTAKNPTTEIYYGEGFRFIFTINLSGLTSKVNSGDLVIDNNTKHYLKMTNTVIGDPKLIGDDKSNGRERATSFDLVVFKLNESWDEGVGFDYEFADYTDDFGDKIYDTRPSNWFNKTTLSGWTTQGIYSTGCNHNRHHTF